MHKWYALIFAFVFLFNCSEPTESTPSNIYPAEPFFTIAPYPLIEINPDRVVTGTCRPGTLSDSIVVTGYETLHANSPIFTFSVLDTLSSADIIPHDNVFRFEIKSTDFPLSQNFTVMVTAYANGVNEWSDLVENIQTVANNKPQITFLQVNDTLASDSSTWNWTLHAFDPDPGEEIHVDILAEFLSGWKKIEEYKENFSLSGNFEINAKFDSTSRAGLIGNTRLRFVISDKLSNTSEDTVTTYIVNSAPVIRQWVFPDTLTIFPNTTSNSIYLIQVGDGQTLADIDSVNILFYRPDSSFSLLVDWFNDEGVNPDNDSGDGWYSAQIPNPNNQESAGTWILKIYARDVARNKSLIKTAYLTLRN